MHRFLRCSTLCGGNNFKRRAVSPGANTRNLVILGMHRSGTSMVAGALASAGLRAGEEGDLLAPQGDNPRGFWERQDVVALNDQLLARVDASWFNPGTQMVALDHDGERELDAIFSRLGGSGWLLKDPRLLLTWPAWEQRLQDATLLFVYRGADGVVNSLEQRNGLPFDYGLALWQYYNQRALELLRDRDFIALSYEQFAAQPDVELAALLQQLRQRGFALDAVALSAEEIFDPALDHTPAADSPVISLMSAAQQSLHETCLEVVETDSVPVEFEVADSSPIVRIASMARAYALAVDARVVVAQLNELQDEHRALAQVHQSIPAPRNRGRSARCPEPRPRNTARAFFRRSVSSQAPRVGTGMGQASALRRNHQTGCAVRRHPQTRRGAPVPRVSEYELFR